MTPLGTLTINKEDKVLRKLRSEVMLIRVTLRQPSKNKQSSRVAEEAAKRTGIDQRSVRASLTRMKHENMDRHQKLLGEARHFLSFRSTPYGEEGWRMIQVRYLPDVKSKLEEYKMKAEELVHKIINEDYDSIREDAMSRLGDEFEWVDFPTREGLAKQYDFEICTKSFETGDNLQIKAASEIVRNIEHEMNQRALETAENARQDVIDRTAETVSIAVDVLESYDQGKEEQERNAAEIKRLKKINYTKTGKSKAVVARYKSKVKAAIKHLKAIRPTVRNNGSAVENLKKLVGVFSEINVTGDEKVAKIGDTLKELMEEFNGDNTKEDKTIRRKCIETNKDILTQLKDIKLVRFN